jgi:hypothetical protein
MKKVEGRMTNLRQGTPDFIGFFLLPSSFFL